MTLARQAAAAQPVDMRLISPGHFVGDTNLPVPGRYRLVVAGGPGTSNASTTFSFTLRKGRQ